MIAILFALIINEAEIKVNRQPCDQLIRRLAEVCTPEYLNDGSRFVCRDPIVRQLGDDIYFSTAREKIGELDEFIISKYEEIELPTSSNTTVTASWIQDRKSWVSSCPVLRCSYEGDEKNFWRLCRLVSRIRNIECSTDLARRRHFPQTKENLAKRELQMRIEGVNLEISRFRVVVLEFCEAYINRVCRNMPEAELVTFKEKVFKIAQLGEIDRAWLFHEVEFQRKQDRECEKKLIRDADGTIRVVK